MQFHRAIALIRRAVMAIYLNGRLREGGKRLVLFLRIIAKAFLHNIGFGGGLLKVIHTLS